MFRRLTGPILDAEPVPQDSNYNINMSHDEKTILALVAALLYSPTDTTPGQAVDRAAALIREVMAR